MPSLLWLMCAVALEVVATSALKASEGFTRLAPTLVVVVGYVASFYCLSQALRTIPMGVAYAIWSGVGIVAISLVGWRLHGQVLDHAALAGIALIVAGVLVIQLLSRSAV